jgi:hypothetical protein
MIKRRKRGITVADLLHELPLVEVALALGVWALNTGWRPGQVPSPGVERTSSPAAVVVLVAQGR